MDRIGRRKVVWPLVAPKVVAGVVICVGIGCLILWSQWYQTPDPKTSTHLIGPSGYVRGQISREKRPGGRQSSTSFSHPHLVEFASSGGPVEVCVVPCHLGYRMEWSNYINQRTAEFAAGQVPKDTVAQASGVRGRIDLNHVPRTASEFSFIVLFRGASGCEVTLVTHYSIW
jgi:hypothetical protein